jgi:hypothetical protein
MGWRRYPTLQLEWQFQNPPDTTSQDGEMTRFFAALLIVTCCTAPLMVRAECVGDHAQGRIADGAGLVKTSAQPQTLNATQVVLPQGMVRTGGTRSELRPLHTDPMAARTGAATVMGAAGLPATLAPHAAQSRAAEAADAPRSPEYVLLLVGLALMVGIALRRNGSGRP